MSHYDTLEVSPQASPEVIRAAYKSLMQRCHPDKNPDNAELAQRAGLITLAYDTLSDHASRSAYDQSLLAAQRTAPCAPRSTPSHVAGRARRSLAPSATHQSRAVAFFWGIVIVIVVAGSISLWLIKSSAARKIAGAPPGTERSSTATSASDTSAAEARVPPAGLAPLPVRLGSALEVRLGGTASEPNRVYVLTIPVLLVFIGRTDAPEFARYLSQQELMLQERLSEQLAFLAQPEELIKASGPQYLRRLIFEALVELTGTETVRRAARPAADALAPEDASAAYGVMGVSIPDGFILK